MNFLRYLIITSFIMLLMACGGAEERKAAYLEKAEQSIKAGDLEKARIELKNALQIDPKDAVAFFKLGNVYERQKDYSKAFANYSKAEELDPENTEYHAKIGRFYLVLARDVEKAKEKLALIQNANKDDVNGLLLEAGILLKEGKIDQATSITQGIFEKHPENIENAIFLSTLYSRDKQYDKAIAVLDKTLTMNPTDQLLMSALGNTLFMSKDFARAESTFRSILDKHPETFENYLRLAVFYQKTEQSDRAEEVLRSAIDLEKDDAKRRLALVEFIQKTKGDQQAITELRNQIKESPNMGDLRLVLGDMLTKDKQPDAAIEIYKNAIKDFSNEVTGVKSRIALAIIYMQRKDVESAQSIINEAADISPNDADVNLVKAKIALYNKDYEKAIISLRTVIKDAPDNIDAYFLLAAAHKANNEEQQAEEIIARAYENNRTNINALLPIAKYYAQNKKINDAERAIDDYLSLDADNYDALSLKSSILNSKKNYTEASKLADRIISLYPNSENGYIQAVPNLLVGKNVKAAIDLLETGYEKTDKNLKILILLADLEINSGKADSAIAQLNTAIQTSDEEKLRLLLAKAYASKNDMHAVISTLEDSIKNNPENIQSYLSLAGIYLRNNQQEKAVSILQQGSKANETDLKTRMQLASIYEKNHELDKAIETYENMLKINEDNILVINNLVSLLSEYREDKTSLDRAMKLAEKLKDATQPVIKDTMGWLYFKTGNYNEAARFLGEAVSAKPDIEVFNYHLGMALLKSGNKEEAKKYLEKATSGKTNYTGRDVAEQTLKSL